MASFDIAADNAVASTGVVLASEVSGPITNVCGALMCWVIPDNFC